MAACYHDTIVFQDPAFGILKGNQATSMWKMLTSNKEVIERIEVRDIQIDGNEGSAHWTAVYFFGPKKRKVINEIDASFTFIDGKIATHTDQFSVWRWSRQALGPVGLFLGWTSFLRKKIQSASLAKLNAYMAKTS